MVSIAVRAAAVSEGEERNGSWVAACTGQGVGGHLALPCLGHDVWRMSSSACCFACADGSMVPGGAVWVFQCRSKELKAV